MIDKVDAIKVAPPVAVAGSELFGLTLPEWVLVATLIYTALQIYLLIRRIMIKGDGLVCTHDECPGRQRK